MNENAFFQKADYTKNQNLVFEDNTIYEVDPVCMGQKREEQAEQSQFGNSVQQIDEIVTGGMLETEEDMEVKNVDDAGLCQCNGRKCRKRVIVWLWFLIFFCFLQSNTP